MHSFMKRVESISSSIVRVPNDAKLMNTFFRSSALCACMCGCWSEFRYFFSLASYAVCGCGSRGGSRTRVVGLCCKGGGFMCACCAQARDGVVEVARVVGASVKVGLFSGHGPGSCCRAPPSPTETVRSKNHTSAPVQPHPPIQGENKEDSHSDETPSVVRSSCRARLILMRR